MSRKQIAALLCGLFLVWLAAASPLAMLDEELLTAHMAQHLLLMTFAPVLLLKGYPALRLRANPVVGWFAATGVLVGWHIPWFFSLGLSSMLWHHVEQLTFLIGGVLFWLPVFQPRPQWSTVIYLFLGTLPCDALSAFLAFCGHVVYPGYEMVPHRFALSALEDQQCAGALMWTCVTFAYLIPAVTVTVKLLSSDSHEDSLRSSVA
jgi:putative membrane protein